MAELRIAIFVAQDLMLALTALCDMRGTAIVANAASIKTTINNSMRVTPDLYFLLYMFLVPPVRLIRTIVYSMYVSAKLEDELTKKEEWSRPINHSRDGVSGRDVLLVIAKGTEPRHRRPLPFFCLVTGSQSMPATDRILYRVQ